MGMQYRAVDRLANLALAPLAVAPLALATLAVVLALFAFGATSKADTVTAHLTNINPFFFGSTLSLDGTAITGDGVGQISWDGSGYNNPVPFNGDFTTFCLDLKDNVTFGTTDTFTLDTDLASAPKPSAGGPMGANSALEMQALYGEQFPTLSTTDDLEAFQLDVWAIVYNGFGNNSVTNTAYNFYAVSGIDSTALAEANTWLAEAYNSAVTDTGTFNTNIVALIGDTAGDGSSLQDQAAIGIIPPSDGVPEISATGLAPLAILLAGALAMIEAARIRKAD